MSKYPRLPHIPSLEEITAQYREGASPDKFVTLTQEQRSENLLFLAEWLLAHPENLEMSDWHKYGPRGLVQDDDDADYCNVYCMDPNEADIWAAECGTTHCVAGHAVAMAGQAGFALEALLDSPPRAARLLLGLGEPKYPQTATANRDVFYTSNETATAWLTRVRDRLRSADPRPVTSPYVEQI